MTTYRITCNAIDYGTYEGTSPADALDAMFRDAGYDGTNDAPSHIDPTVFRVVPA